MARMDRDFRKPDDIEHEVELVNLALEYSREDQYWLGIEEQDYENDLAEAIRRSLEDQERLVMKMKGLIRDFYRKLRNS